MRFISMPLARVPADAARDMAGAAHHCSSLMYPIPPMSYSGSRQGLLAPACPDFFNLVRILE